MVEVEDLRELPKSLLTRLYDTSCILTDSIFIAYGDIDYALRQSVYTGQGDIDPGLLKRWFELAPIVDREREWRRRINEALRERRTAWCRIDIDAFLDEPDAG